ncbi:SHC-transforming protein 4 [Trichinella spiralis]|uniref:SHC-transforming protein 4 n=1 Tax=Trichinella spiralis TaxID=6334 RepID=A0A0V1BCB9_TRISP|nr:SHC-transforming protein 4 [Trichinella spiralis]
MNCNGPVHSANALRNGLSYDLRYIGRLAVNASMKQIEFNVRSALAKECIWRVCTVANQISSSRHRKVDKELLKYIAAQPNLDAGGQNVRLFISTQSLTVLSLDTDRVLFVHSMPDISFASCGDQATSEFIAYIAKTAEHGRQCYVFECALGAEKEVLATIGQAFALRFEHATQTSMCLNPERSATTVNVVSSAVGSCADRSGVDLSCEPWYHGRITREQSQLLVRQDGDFLVRQSCSDPSQYVLTGMQDGKHRHLLLIDDDGAVRTKDRQFENVPHLINYHRENKLPITSLESALVLRNVIPRTVAI